MERTRILIVAVPRMLRDIVAGTLARERDMEVVGEFADAGSLMHWLQRSSADIAVLGRDDASLAAALLGERPQLKVLAIAGQGRESCLYELHPKRVPLGEISPQKLIDVIRRAARGQAASTCGNA